MVFCCISATLSPCQTHTFLDSRPGKIIANPTLYFQGDCCATIVLYFSHFWHQLQSWAGCKIKCENLRSWWLQAVKPTARDFGHSFETWIMSIECDFDAFEDSDDVYCTTGNDVCVFPKIGSGQRKPFCKCRDHVLDGKKLLFAKSSDLADLLPIIDIYKNSRCSLHGGNPPCFPFPLQNDFHDLWQILTDK